VTGGLVVWLIDGGTFLPSQLRNGMPPGHNISGTNILILNLALGDSRNGSKYVCVLPQSPPPDIESDPAFLYVAGEFTTVHTIHMCVYYVWERRLLHMH